MVEEGGSWATDYPKADRIFLSFIDRLLPNLDAYEHEFVVTLAEPDLRRFPFLYALEVGAMSLSPEEIEGLRGYLLAGGFLVIDDFWGTREWQNFEYEIRRVLPEYDIVDLPIDHPIFTTFYEIEEIIQVPNIGNGVRGGRTWECRERCFPVVRGIHGRKRPPQWSSSTSTPTWAMPGSGRTTLTTRSNTLRTPTRWALTLSSTR